MDQQAMRAARARIGPGEALLWAGRPHPLTFAVRVYSGKALFGVPFLAFAVFWTVMASQGAGKDSGGPGAYFPLFGLPFVLVGLAMVLSPVWGYLRASRMAYALTDRRAVILSEFPRLQVTSIEPRQIGPIDLLLDRDGRRGTVLFFDRPAETSEGRAQRDGFYGIDRPEEVARLLRERVGAAGESVSRA